MKSTSLAVVATAISMLAGAPAIARADVASASPIVVTNATLHPAPGELFGPNFLTIAFENAHAVDATKVVFDVRGGAYRQRIVDVGTFAPGTTIDHAFLDYSGAADRTVDVVEVDFSDGTTWTSDDTGSPR